MKIWTAAIATLLVGCSTHYSAEDLTLESDNVIALMPIINYSQTPLAGEKAESLVSSLWSQTYDSRLLVYPTKTSEESKLPALFDDKRYQQAQGWLQQQNTDYYLTGVINEWHYKAGLDAEPAVGITLVLHRSEDDRIVWSSTAARAGWSRESLTSTAHKVIDELLQSVDVE
ncbi:hypothetical protein [Marinobacterium jannaschii]|uniref:hypothetical protein n=1 Tax=Marinobacterium jannaschii TaxID=64970 RepID=UPI000487A06B|nr:hypothetical protein [Marinobacterium jannaschii]